MPKPQFESSLMEWDSSETLYLAIEMGDRGWRLGFGTPRRQSVRIRGIEADDLEALHAEIAKARSKLGFREDCSVVVAYEAGFSGFWVARELRERGLEVLVLPSTVLEDNRGRRRVKTDRLDVKDLVRLLIRYHFSEERWLFTPVAVPPKELEDRQMIHRERQVLKTERGKHRNRIRGLLRSVGLRPNWKRRSNPIPDGLDPHRAERIRRELDRLKLVEEQLEEIEAKRRELVRGQDSEECRKTELLQCLVGLGPNGSWLLAHEVFWRKFKNRRQVGAFAGLTTIPYQSGSQSRDRGISKRGNGLVRSTLIEISWLWIRYQPGSAITRWYFRRFAGKRPRKIGIVAVARKLLVALWRFVEHGVVPEGVRLKRPIRLQAAG